MINKMQTRMINHILNGRVEREEDLLNKIKNIQTFKKSSGSKFYKNKTKDKNFNRIDENDKEYIFITTDNTIKNEKEESKDNLGKIKNHKDNDAIKITENAFIKDPSSKISQKNELIYKSDNEKNDYISDEGYPISNKNINELCSSQNNNNYNELQQKEYRDNGVYEVITSRKNITQQYNGNKDKDNLIKRSAEVLMKSSFSKNLDSQHRMEIKHIDKEYNSRKNTNYSKEKRRSPSSKIKVIDNSAHTKRNSSNGSTTNNIRRSISQTKGEEKLIDIIVNNENNLNLKLEVNSVENVKTTHDCNTSKNNNNLGFRNSLSLNSNKMNNIGTSHSIYQSNIKRKSNFNKSKSKSMNHIQIHDGGEIELKKSIYQNQNKAPRNNKEKNIIEKPEKSSEFNTNINKLDVPFNIFHVESIDEKVLSNSNLNRSNNIQSGINIYKNNCEPISDKEMEHYKADLDNINSYGKNNINEESLILKRNAQVLENKNDKNEMKLSELDDDKKHKRKITNRPNSISDSNVISNTIKNSKFLISSRLNTSHKEKKNSKKRKKISLISPDNFKNDFIKYENLHTNRRNSHSNKSEGNKGFSHPKLRFSNVLSSFNNNELNVNYDYNSLSQKNVNKNYKEQNKHMFIENNPYVIKFDHNNQGLENNKSHTNNIVKRRNYNSHDLVNKLDYLNTDKPQCDNFKTSYNYYDNIQINYKNDFDTEINTKIPYMSGRSFYSKSDNYNYSSSSNFYKSSNENLNMRNSIKNFTFNYTRPLESNSRSSNKDKFISSKDLINKINHENDVPKVVRESNDENNLNSNNNNSKNNKEIKPSNTDKFKDLSPIRESDYSNDVQKNLKMRIKQKSENAGNDGKMESNKNITQYHQKNDNINSKINKLKNKSKITKLKENFKILSTNNIENNFKNLYNYNNSKNNDFIYDEFNEKILPLINFEGESYPENLFKEDKYLKQSSHDGNVIDKNKENLPNKLKEFSNTASSTFKKSDMSNSKITKKKISNIGYVPWDKVYKEKFKEDFKGKIN